MKNKNNKIGVLISVYFITFLFIGTAYSFLNENLELKGKVGFSPDSLKDYSYSYILKSSWNDGTFYYYYFTPTITYKGKDNINSWEANINVPVGTEVTGCYEASECIVINDILKIKNATWNGTLIPNESFTFGFQIKTKNNNYIFSIENVNFYKEDIVIENPDMEIEKIDGFETILKLENSWGNTSQYTLNITNNSNIKLKSWKIELAINKNTKVASLWGANYVSKDNLLLSGLSWNSTIDIGSSISNIGFQLKNTSDLTISSFIGVTSDNKTVEINI